jgi:hypothetical protein
MITKQKNQKVWTCPCCNSVHHGFNLNQCQNAKCEDYEPYASNHVPPNPQKKTRKKRVESNPVNAATGKGKQSSLFN